MRAIVLDKVPAAPKLSELDPPPLDAGHVLVDVAASSVNGFDLAVAAGYVQGVMEHRFPLIPGKDFAGTVTEVGIDVDRFATGDRVFGVVTKPYLGAGSYAEQVTVPTAVGLAPLPDPVSDRDAGALGLAGTAALDSLSAAGDVAGRIVLISGATGGVGAFAVQLAALRGARVLATAKLGDEAEFIAGLTDGGVEVVDYTDDVMAATKAVAPGGVDVALHFAGDLAVLTSLVRDGGAVVSTIASPEAPAERGLRTTMVMAAPTSETLTTLAGHVAAGELIVPIEASYSLADLGEAFAAFGAGTRGKIAVEVR